MPASSRPGRAAWLASALAGSLVALVAINCGRERGMRPVLDFETMVGVHHVSYQPSGAVLAVAGQRFDSSRPHFAAYQLGLVDARSGDVRRLVPLGGIATALAFAPDGRTVAVATAPTERTVRVDLIDVATGRADNLIPAGDGTIGGVGFTADGATLAVGGGTTAPGQAAAEPGASMFALWDVAGRREVHREVRPGELGGPLAVAPDGRFVVLGGTTAAGAGWVRAVDLTTRGELWRVDGPPGGVAALGIAADSQSLAVGDPAGFVSIRAAGTGAESGRHKVGALLNERLLSLAFVPGKPWLALGLGVYNRAGGSGRVALLDLTDPPPRTALLGSAAEPVIGVACSSQGDRIAAATRDGKLRVYATADLKRP